MRHPEGCLTAWPSFTRVWRPTRRDQPVTRSPWCISAGHTSWRTDSRMPFRRPRGRALSPGNRRWMKRLASRLTWWHPAPHKSRRGHCFRSALGSRPESPLTSFARDERARHAELSVASAPSRSTSSTSNATSGPEEIGGDCAHVRDLAIGRRSVVGFDAHADQIPPLLDELVAPHPWPAIRDVHRAHTDGAGGRRGAENSLPSGHGSRGSSRTAPRMGTPTSPARRRPPGEIEGTASRARGGWSPRDRPARPARPTGRP